MRCSRPGLPRWRRVEDGNLADSDEHVGVRDKLTELLIDQLYGGDNEWLADDRLIGLHEETQAAAPNRNLSLERCSLCFA